MQFDLVCRLVWIYLEGFRGWYGILVDRQLVSAPVGNTRPRGLYSRSTVIQHAIAILSLYQSLVAFFSPVDSAVASISKCVDGAVALRTASP